MIFYPQSRVADKILITSTGIIISCSKDGRLHQLKGENVTDSVSAPAAATRVYNRMQAMVETTQQICTS